MRASNFRLSFAILALVCMMPSAWAAQEQSDVKQGSSAATCPAAELLKGVVHLSDDDVRFRTADGTVIFVDPVNGPDSELAKAAGMDKPDLILITHAHDDHFQPGALHKYIKLNPEVVLAGPAKVVDRAAQKRIDNMQTVEPEQDYTMAGVAFRTVPSYFENPQYGHPKENLSVGYVLKINGASYYVTGDTQALPEMEQVQVDVVFPLLFGCGGNSAEAVRMAQFTKARLAVPVHHGGQLPAVEKFIGELPAEFGCAYFMDGKLVSSPKRAASQE
jgi:L-ascorbate metabolism protein UlaG (beta-lactamase superfamily)